MKGLGGRLMSFDAPQRILTYYLVDLVEFQNLFMDEIELDHYP